MAQSVTTRVNNLLLDGGFYPTAGTVVLLSDAQFSALSSGDLANMVIAGAYVPSGDAAIETTRAMAAELLLYSKLKASATLTFTSIAAGTTQSQTVACTGAVVGNAVAVGAPAAIATGFVWSGYVSATDVVTVRVANVTSGALTPAALVWNVSVVT